MAAPRAAFFCSFIRLLLTAGLTHCSNYDASIPGLVLAALQKSQLRMLRCTFKFWL
jgi:hypothetical protein